MKRIFIVLLLFQIIILSSCSQNNYLNYKDLNPKVTNLISDTYVNEIRYSGEAIEQIRVMAKEYGIMNPYIPTRGIGSDYVMEIREKEKSIMIVFPHFSLTQSLQNTIATEDIIEVRNIELEIGNAKWIRIQNNPPVLYIKLKNVFISISTAKSFQEKDFENIIESLVPLNNELN